jgi:hypothetical protein
MPAYDDHPLGEDDEWGWHWSADLTPRPLYSSSSMAISEWNPRTVQVSGTTWTTEGSASRMP